MSDRITFRSVATSPWRQLKGGGTPSERLRLELEVLLFGLVLSVVLLAFYFLTGSTHLFLVFAAILSLAISVSRVAVRWIDAALVKRGFWRE